jgi:hypothetical protein
MKKEKTCRSYKADNGYTNVTICNCKHPSK